MTARTTLKTIAITMAGLGAGIAPAAFAAPAVDNVSAEIDTRYLATDWGVEKVYETLSSQAKSACITNSSISLAARKFERDCMTDLLDDFIENANIEKLTTYHAKVTT